MKKKSTFFIALVLISVASLKAQTNFALKLPVWLTFGNRNTNPAKDFLGTTDRKDLVFRTNNTEHLRITKDGSVGIDVAAPLQKMDINGNINITDGSGFYINNTRVLYTKSSNIFVGQYAGNNSVSGTFNTGLGHSALTSNTIGSGNVALGSEALFNNNEGYNNTACGTYALSNNISGYNNTAVGDGALFGNITGKENTASGYFALASNTIGVKNTASGLFSMYSNTTGSGNTAYGALAMYSNKEGLDNLAFGASALYSNASGGGNLAIGYQALYYSNSFYNTAIGVQALYHNENGAFNIALGLGALYNNVSGNNNTACGYYSGVNTNTLYNTTTLGYGAVATASNQVHIGNSAVTSIGGFTNWTNISDVRVKTNIKENVPGLSFINKLKPITYTLSLDAADKIIQAPVIKDLQGKVIEPTQEQLTTRKTKEQIVYTGFAAQDVEKAAKSLNYDFSGVDAPKNDKDLYGLRYSEFVVPLVKAVQELSAKNDALEEENKQLEKRIEKLEILVNAQFPNLSLQSNTNAIQVKVFPNPFQSVINIDLSKTGAGKKAINVYDANGKLLITQAANGYTQINTALLAAGAYMVKINDGDGKELFNGKVIKQ
ncbi:MAG TPA: T9SS type A sorting domain-containing protein [Chitinophagaceae bacterium]|nr:T9SS type A sorting domain-containing protein [Chitinophagaceae bacterium]